MMGDIFSSKHKFNFKISIYKNIALILFILSSTIYSYPVFDLWFWLVDDHEIFAFIGRPGNCTYTNFFTMLGSVEELRLQTTRFRPIFYLFRVFETILWCDNPRSWFFSRVLIFVASVYISVLPLIRLRGYIFAIFSAVLIISSPFYVDILPRLGPQELYCFFGLSIYIYCASFLYCSQKFHEKTLIIFWTFSAILCMGSKEQFLFIFPISICIVMILVFEKGINNCKLWILSLLSQGVFFIYMFNELFFRIIAAKEDIYGQSINPFERALFSINNIDFYSIFSIIIINVAIIFLVAKRQMNIKSVNLNHYSGLILSGFLVIFIFLINILFYQGHVNLFGRYGFPSYYLALLFLLYICAEFLPDYSNDCRSKKLFGILFILAFIIYFTNSYVTRSYIKVASLKRGSVHEQLESLKVKKLTTEDYISIDFDGDYSYEPLLAIRTLLAYYDLNSKIVVTTGDDRININLDLVQISEYGLPEIKYYSSTLPKILPNGNQICSKIKCNKIELSGGY